MLDTDKEAAEALERINERIYLNSKEAKAELGKMTQTALQNIELKYKLITSMGY